MKKKSNKLGVLLVCLLILICVLILFLIGKYSLTGNVVLERKMTFFFYDVKHNCSIEGEVYVDNNLIGRANSSGFIVDEGIIQMISKNSSMSLRGVSGICFGRSRNLPFAESWNITSLNSYLRNNGRLRFVSKMNLRVPRANEAMQGFVRPYETANLTKTLVNENKSRQENMDEIARHSISYFEDFSLFNASDYWQTPRETMILKRGDCEDWATLVLSMLREYSNSSSCYLVLWDSHINVLCRFNSTFILYDQKQIRKSAILTKNPNQSYIVNQENKIAFRQMLGSYFKDYGIDVKERKVSALINDREIIPLKDVEGLVSWAVSYSTE